MTDTHTNQESAGDSTPLGLQQRQQFANLVGEKAKNVIAALQKEVTADADAIETRLLARNGLSMSYDDLEREIRKLQRQLDEVDFDDDATWSNLKEQRDDLDETVESEQQLIRQRYEAEIQSVRSKMNQELHQATTGKSEREAVLTQQMEVREEELLKVLVPGVQEQIDTLRTQVPTARALSRSLRTEVEHTQQAIEQSRGRLVALVGDAAVRAKTNLLMATTMGEARKWLDSIPSVAEMIAIAENPEQGLKGMVERLTPEFRLSLPQPKSEDTTETDESEVEISRSNQAIEVQFVD